MSWEATVHHHTKENELEEADYLLFLQAESGIVLWVLEFLGERVHDGNVFKRSKQKQNKYQPQENGSFKKKTINMILLSNK